ncbi:MAG: hypothetical protein J5525_02020 [Lachnospiraceae bacterium]|nr:hypothetical protein [Lachnospiraceae bacterium]
MEEEKKKPNRKRLYVLLIILILLIVYMVLAFEKMAEDEKRVDQTMDLTNYRNQPYNDYGAPVIYYKSDIERDTKTRLSKKETEFQGYKCTQFMSDKKNPTDYDSMIFYTFKDGSTASKAFSSVKENVFRKITDEGNNFVQGWIKGVSDAEVERYFYLNGNLIISTDITCIGLNSDSDYDPDENEVDINDIRDPQNQRSLIIKTFGTREDAEKMATNPFIFKGKLIVGDDIGINEINEFYYTYENINYDACYLRYRFYKEDSKFMFFYEKRERPNDYGPATESDTTAKGTIELTDEQWSEFFEFVNGGIVKKRGDNADSGSCGPWLYLYWEGDNDKYQEFTFESVSKELDFEDYCSRLSRIEID